MTDTLPSSLLRDILAKLDRGGARDSRWPDARSEYWALCPFHADHHAGSFSVSERGFSCFACGAKGGLAELADRLGVAVLQANPGGNGLPFFLPLTLEEYATAKRLPLPFLEGLGLRTARHSGRQAVRIPYLDKAGSEVAVRFRHSLAGAGKGRFTWRKGDSPLPYGLWRLGEVREAGYVVLVEGESDSQTLWLHRLPALGIPGAATWRAEWAQHLDGLAAYAWQEPDDGGVQFVKGIGESLPGLQVLRPPEGRKDISECHVLGDDVPALVERLIAAATSYEQIKAAALAADAAKAEAQAGALLGCPDLLAAFTALCRQLGLVGEDRNAQLLYLALTSRFLEKPVSVAVKGPSSAGKSFLVETVLRAFPQAAYYALSSMSERALAYSQEPLSNRMLVLYEAVGLSGDFATYLLRSLLSEGRVRYETVEKGQDGLQPRLIEREGPTGAITTTTSVSLDPELETRLISLTVRDDTQQTRSVLSSLADRANGRGPGRADLAQWQALQEWLQMAGLREVTIPYAHELADGCEPSAVRLRRDFSSLLSLVKAHAILHQRQRRADGGRAVAEVADYRTVHGLVADLLDEGVQATVPPRVREAVEAVAALHASTAGPVSLTALAARLGLDKSAASRRVAQARREGWIVNQETRRGMPAQLVPGEPMPAEKRVLPDPDTLQEKESGVIPPETHATLQHLPQGKGGEAPSVQPAGPRQRLEKKESGAIPPETHATPQHLPEEESGGMRPDPQAPLRGVQYLLPDDQDVEVFDL